jgi:hypothetical protein
MSRLYVKNVYYRAATTPITTIARGGTYPNYTFSGFTQLVGAIDAGAKLGIDPENEDRGDGTQATVGESIPVEIPIKDFTVANVTTIRSAFINTKLDIMVLDPDQPDVAYVAHGVVLYPKIEATGGEVPKLTLTGTRKSGVLATSLFQPVTITT